MNRFPGLGIVDFSTGFKAFNFQQVDTENLRTVLRYHFLQMESGVCAALANDCDGNSFPEARKETNSAFVQ